MAEHEPEKTVIGDFLGWTDFEKWAREIAHWYQIHGISHPECQTVTFATPSGRFTHVEFDDHELITCIKEVGGVDMNAAEEA